MRNNSCIDGDDDIDICVNSKHNVLLREIMKNNLSSCKAPTLVKTCYTPKLSSIDFYMCDVKSNGDFYDTHERVTWSSVYGPDKSLV